MGPSDSYCIFLYMIVVLSCPRLAFVQSETSSIHVMVTKLIKLTCIVLEGIRVICKLHVPTT
jgi:hypothetical protein